MAAWLPLSGYQTVLDLNHSLSQLLRVYNPSTTTISTVATRKRASMKILARALSSSIAILVLTLATNITVHAQRRIGIEDRFANINGVRLHYLIAGKGDPVNLLHGYAETSRM